MEKQDSNKKRVKEITMALLPNKIQALHKFTSRSRRTNPTHK